MKEQLTKTKEEICEILGIKLDNLRQIESRGKLKERLKDKGYELISKEKNGRSYIYIISQFSETLWLLNNICKYVMDTNQMEEFAKYFLYRTDNVDQPITKELLANLVNVDRHTIGKWDDKMCETEILNKDGWYYVAVDYNENQERKLRLTCEEEYNSYLKASRCVKLSTQVKLRYIAKDISLEEFQLLIEQIASYQTIKERKFVYRVNKYQLEKNSDLFKDILDLINDNYDIKDTRIDLDKELK